MRAIKCVALLACFLAFAVQTCVAQDQEEKSSGSGLKTMLQFATKPGMPSLDGLIRPESMEALSGNKLTCKPLSENKAPTASNNSALSDNRTELISRNRLLSGLKFMSDININVNINIRNSGNEGRAVSPQHAKSKRKSVAKKKRARRNRHKKPSGHSKK